MTEVQRSASGGGVGSSDFCFRAVNAPGQVRARARNQHERAPPPPKRKQAEPGAQHAIATAGRNDRAAQGRRGHGGAPAPLRCALGHRRAAKRRSEAAFGKGVKW